MKDYEIYSQLKIPKNSKIIVRLDGRSFHSLARVLNLEKPYDDNFSNLMVDVACDLFKEFAPSFIYTFSDEISIILDNIPFSGRIEKIDSVLASFAASSFSFNFNRYFKGIVLNKPIAFDSRVIPIRKEEIPDYFKWRQDEAWRNCVNSYGITFLKSKYSTEEANKRIKGLKYSDIHEMLFKNGINLNDVESSRKRGIAIYKKEKEIKGFNKKDEKEVISYRNYLFKDYNIPIFTKEFFNKLNLIE